MFPNPLWHIQLQSEALRTKASVEFLFDLFLVIQNQQYANGIPKWAELAGKRMDCLMSNCKSIMWFQIKLR